MFKGTFKWHGFKLCLTSSEILILSNCEIWMALKNAFWLTMIKSSYFLRACKPTQCYLPFWGYTCIALDVASQDEMVGLLPILEIQPHKQHISLLFFRLLGNVHQIHLRYEMVP